MEILLAAITIITISVVVILVGTRGNPLKVVTAFGSTMKAIRENSFQLFLVISIVLLTVIFIYLFYLAPGINAGPAQPIPFSHRLHAGHKDIDCRFCHPYVDRSIHPGIPPVEKCLYCHKYIIPKHPEIKKEHKYFETKTPTPWVKVFYVPEHVLFNHERHIKKEIECVSCHGQIEEQDRLKGKRFKMGFCLDCHHEKNAPVGCWLSCHN